MSGHEYDEQIEKASADYRSRLSESTAIMVGVEHDEMKRALIGISLYLAFRAGAKFQKMRSQGLD